MPGMEADHWGSTGGAHIGAGATLVGHILGLVQQRSWRVTIVPHHHNYSVKYIYIIYTCICIWKKLSQKAMIISSSLIPPLQNAYAS